MDLIYRHLLVAVLFSLLGSSSGIDRDEIEQKTIASLPQSINGVPIHWNFVGGNAPKLRSNEKTEKSYTWSIEVDKDVYAIPGHNKTIRNTKHCKGKVDVIFVLDSSSSVRADGWTKELEFVSDVVKHFTVGPDHVQVGAVAFSYLGELLFNLKDHKSVAGIEKALKSARFIDSQSNIDKALNVINSKKMFSKEHGGRPGVPKIVFIISDGPSTDLPKTLEETFALRKAKVRIISMGVGNEVSNVEMFTISKSTDVIRVADFFNMKPALADAVDTICINLPEQVQLEIPSKVLVFVIQFSGKVDSPEWAMLMEFVTTTIRNLQLGPNGTEVVVATVRRMINVYDFRQFTSHATIERVLLGSATITPTTVINMKELFKKIYSWKYPKSVQMILQICTDNYSEITTIDDEIKKWLSLGHLVHITAIGDKAPIEDIVRVVQDPENIQIIESYDLLATTTITLLQKIISGDVQVTVKNVSDISSFTCQVKTELDVIFVIDISASICVTGWNKVSRFLLDVVNFFKLGDTEVKVGAVFYSHEPQRVFDLRAFGEFKNIEKRLNEPHLSSTTRTDKAMKAIMEWNMFEPTSGGRHNVQDVIVLLTDGHSTNRKKAQLAADELMKKNVKVITLGVGRDVALKELRGLSHSRNHVIPTETFDKAQFAKLYLAKTICDAVSI